MPRKTKYSQEDVVRAAFELVREKGLSGLSAPAVAEKMGCSTMPIYSHFKNMQALEDEVVKKAWKLSMEYKSYTYTGDVWIDQGIGYVIFSKKEQNLFKCMLDSRNIELKYEMHLVNWQFMADQLKGYDSFKELNEEQQERVRYARAMLTHGIATAARVAANKILIEDDQLLAMFMTNVSKALLAGFKEIPPITPKDRQRFKERKNRIPNY
jgi:AcrR family transcriptional regulator